MAVEYMGEREVIPLGTTTKTLITEGFASHNSPPDGMHDDCVDALALAVQQWRQHSGWWMGEIREESDPELYW